MIQTVFIVPVVEVALAQMLKHVYRIHTKHTFSFMWKTLTFKMQRSLNQLASLLGIFKENTLCLNLNRVQRNKEKEKMMFIKKALQHSTNSLCKTSVDCCVVAVACFLAQRITSVRKCKTVSNGTSQPMNMIQFALVYLHLKAKHNRVCCGVFK